MGAKREIGMPQRKNKNRKWISTAPLAPGPAM
jgi:hypothetical protein